MPKFRNKPVVIEALQFNGLNHDAIADFCAPAPVKVGSSCTLVIPTLDGDHVARKNDWIIRGIKGEFYPCKPDIFEQIYEPVE